MILKELLDDIHSLNRELEKYERKFGITSEDFYQLYQQGKLENSRKSRSFVSGQGYTK